jgi:hypothetical protein
MKTNKYCFIFLSLLCILFLQNNIFAQTCQSCHSYEANLWNSTKHANTQTDVAGELAANWIGETADSVISGTQAEDCISCHSPRSVTSNGGMTEIQAINYFFSTTNGKFTNSTNALNTAGWQHVTCETCHEGMIAFGVYNSKTNTYDPVKTSNDLCGNCHGTVRNPDTDHRIYDAWRSSRHGQKGQSDVASELVANHIGETPAEVIASENCIGCHAPTAVTTLEGAMNEGQALDNFFTTTDGKFTASTSLADTIHFPYVSCITCHDPHNPDAVSYYNSSTKSYKVMASTDLLCGQCHGNLRFPDTDHLTYNLNTGTGGQNVPNISPMNGIKCIDCHMYNSGVDGTNSIMFKGHSWSVFVKETDGSTTASCTNCHSTMSSDASIALVTKWQSDFQTLDSIAGLKVTAAGNHLLNSTDSANFAEAQFNLSYAESDEGGGVHNHLYSAALLNDAISKSDKILTGIVSDKIRPLTFSLSQNYPNPFNPSTKINFTIPQSGYVTLKIYDMVGREVATLVNGNKNEGIYSIDFSAAIVARELSSGIYIYQLKEGNFIQTRKMVLLK